MPGGPRTLTELLESLRDSEQTITFADTWSTLAHRDLPTAAREVAGRLRALGAGPGDIVGLLMPTGPAWITGFFGVITAGAAATGLPLPPVAPAAVVTHLTAIVRAGGVRYLLAAGIGVTVATALAEQIPKRGSSIWTPRAPSPTTPTRHLPPPRRTRSRSCSSAPAAPPDPKVCC